MYVFNINTLLDMPPLFPRNPTYKNTPVPRSVVRNYTFKNNISRTPTAFLATNTNMTRRMKIKQNRANVEAQNLIRRVQVMVNNARKNKKNNTPIPFDSYIKILKATKISDLASIGINTTPSKDERAKLKSYKILVLNELFTLFLVIIGEVLEYTINGDLEQLKRRVDDPNLISTIRQGRQAYSQDGHHAQISLNFFGVLLGLRGGSRSMMGGFVAESVGLAVAALIAISPFIVAFRVYVYYRNKKQEINFMELLLLTYNTFFSSNASVEYRNEINYYEINQEQKNLFYKEADTFKNSHMDNKADVLAFKNFIVEFINLKLYENLNRNPRPNPNAAGTGLSEARRFPTVTTTGQKPAGPPQVRSFIPGAPMPYRPSAPLGATLGYYGTKPAQLLGPTPGKVSTSRTPNKIEAKPSKVKDILAAYEARLQKR